MCAPIRAYSFGDEYHTICCMKSWTIYQIELVEEKDKPKPEFYNRKSPTTSLLLRLY